MKQPNVVLILMDDWGYGDLGCYGHPELQTPCLDKLASEGTRFTQFYVSSPVCSPSRVSFLTGQYPARHAVHAHFARYDENERRNMPNWLDVNVCTLPRVLKQAGYATAHYGKWHLGGGAGQHGYPDAPYPKTYGYDDTRVWNGNGPGWLGKDYWPFPIEIESNPELIPATSEVAVNAAIRFIESNATKPFFINLWLKDPHTPLEPTDEQREPYKNLEEPKQTYYSVLTNADKQIGRLVDRIDELGLGDDTIIIFTSDNGPRLYDLEMGLDGSTAGLRGHKGSIYEGGIRVPFIMRHKGQIKQASVDNDSLIASVDLMPTICKLAGADIPDYWMLDGEDISDCFMGKTKEKRDKLLMWEWRYNGFFTEGPIEHVYAARQDDWIYIESLDGTRTELYNIHADYTQENNRFEKDKDIASSLQQQLSCWKATL
jgi:N-acetylgalactosamine-6-sulfatase